MNAKVGALPPLLIAGALLVPCVSPAQNAPNSATPSAPNSAAPSAPKPAPQSAPTSAAQSSSKSAPAEREQRARHRAQNAQRAGDLPHAAQLRALADQLAAMARDLSRATSAEHELAELERQESEIEARAVRAQALVELTAAQRGRAAESLEAIEAAKAAPPAAKP